jgi:hypothetical protein
MDQILLDRLQPHLEPGEKVLWLGQPDRERARPYRLRQVMWAGAFVLLLVLVMQCMIWGVMALSFWTVGTGMALIPLDVLFANGPLSFGIVLAIAAIVHVGSRIGVRFSDAFDMFIRGREDVYAVTDRSILALMGKTRRFPLEKAYNVWVRHHAGGTSSIVFLDASYRVKRSRKGYNRNLSFRMIPDVDRAVTTAWEAAQQAGYEDPGAVTQSLQMGELVCMFWIEWLCGRRALDRLVQSDTPVLMLGTLVWRLLLKLLFLAIEALILGVVWSKIWVWLAGFKDFAVEMYMMSYLFVCAFEVWYAARKPRYRRLRRLAISMEGVMLVLFMLWFIWWNRSVFLTG